MKAIVKMRQTRLMEKRAFTSPSKSRAIDVQTEFPVEIPTKEVGKMPSTGYRVKTMRPIFPATEVRIEMTGPNTLGEVEFSRLLCQPIPPLYICTYRDEKTCIWGHLPLPSIFDSVMVQERQRLPAPYLTKFCPYLIYKEVIAE